MTERNRSGFMYRAFRVYLRLVHDVFFYKNVYQLGVENIPPDGTPVLVVSNHLNCLCDPLGVVLGFKDRKPYTLARADVFAAHPLANIFLRKIGLLPAYRLDFEGEDALKKNKDSFQAAEEALSGGKTILMYPEGGHQDKRTLGDFSLGYLKLAFEAAEKDDFRTEIFILPSCNHYSDCFDIQKDILIKYGKPVSIAPYYELYKTKPRTAQRQANVLVREQIADMMLNITDAENYDAIDFLRNTYGKKYASEHGFRAGYLPEQLLSDRAFCKALENVDKAQTQHIYNDALTLSGEIKRLKIRDDHFDHTPTLAATSISIAALIVLFPLWLLSLWPNLLIYKAPEPVMRRINDKLFHNSFLYGISVLFTIPALYALTFVLACIYINVWAAAIYTAALPFLGLFAWYYRQHAVRTRQNIRYRAICRTESAIACRNLRTSIHKRLNKLLK